MTYRCEAQSIEGFIQMLASNYLPHGYWFYVAGRVPPGKDRRAVDHKLITKYGIALSRQQRARRKQAGIANLQYIRFQEAFALLATRGRHPFFLEERERIRDIRKHPLHFAGYSLTVRRGGFLKREVGDEEATPDGRYRVRVMIAREQYRDLLAYFCDLAVHRSPETLGRALRGLPFEPYAPIRKQLLRLLRSVNQKRAAMGYQKLSPDVLRYRRTIVKPFGTADEEPANPVSIQVIVRAA